ncbi:hypothetical protein [Lysinibacillus sp. JNUCC-52]|uniref:hypothetical protein n=1 Tax=Lysinibacillus sp. JNUCC-52 TaxID=2792480 RepID=UPI001936415A|nr:hypothetical protein JNUCC52_07705 [Lysinibacillus sp. JNUCC-52]
MSTFSRSKSIKGAANAGGQGVFTLTVVGSDKSGSNYDVACTLDTEFFSGVQGTLRIQSIVNGSWYTHREYTGNIPVANFPANFNGDGRLNYTFASVTDANRSQMRIQATVAGITWAIDPWNEGNM